VFKTLNSRLSVINFMGCYFLYAIPLKKLYKILL